jgi:penicillin-binding protein 1C
MGALLVLNVVFPPPLTKAYNQSIVVTDKDGQWLSVFPVEDGRWRIKTDIDDIDPRFVDALLAIEDKRFWQHSGVDPIAVIRAVRSWGRAGRAVSGASTITMQLVRQLEPRERTLGSKVVETLRAVQIELRLSKREILSLYLTHAPYGGNIEGLEAASLIYFDKHSDQLTTAQIALLIALPQAPEARRPDRHMKTAQNSRKVILDKLRALDMIDVREHDEALEEPIPARKSPIVQKSWLSAQGLRRNATHKNGKVISALDGALQASLERVSAQYTNTKDFNVSILVVDNKTMKVRGHIGSAGRDRPGGWIDMSTIPRSPGSTLKPFIYGMAFDDGLSAPGSLIMDAPTRFGSYQPENFNRRYHGSVRVYEALAHSLNVPAVLALDKIGANRFVAALNLGGAHIQTSSGNSADTGLAIALGGAGMRAQDLAGLYAGLANGGKVRPLNWLENDTLGKTVQIMRPDSAAKITHILRQAPTPSGRVPHWLTQGAHAIAYKTGTSYGFRDAWAAGYTDEWTVIVWTGRPDGAPRVGKTGRNTAAPLMFDVFAVLPNSQTRYDYQKIEHAPAGLVEFGRENLDHPEILFPPDGAEIAVSDFGESARGLTLSLRNPKNTPVNWYVDGRPLKAQSLSGQPIWRPERAGFYTLSLVDDKGDVSRASVRVISIRDM